MKAIWTSLPYTLSSIPCCCVIIIQKYDDELTEYNLNSKYYFVMRRKILKIWSSPNHRFTPVIDNRLKRCWFVIIIKPIKNNLRNGPLTYYYNFSAQTLIPIRRIFPANFSHVRRTRFISLLIYYLFLLPQEAGLPIGGPDFNGHVMLELHYNNPGLRKGKLNFFLL